MSGTISKTKEFPLFREDCFFTDDTVMTVAIAEGLMNGGSEDDFIDAMISLGGDSDTLAAITGSIAEAAYGIPQWIKDKAWTYLDEPIKDVCRRWRTFLSRK